MSKRLVALLMAALVMTTSVPVNAAPAPGDVQETANSYAAAVNKTISLVRVEGSKAYISVAGGLAEAPEGSVGVTNEYLELEYSNNAEFKEDKKAKPKGFVDDTRIGYNELDRDNVFSFNLSNVGPDETMYIRTRVPSVDASGNYVYDANEELVYTYGNTIKVKPQMAKVNNISAIVSGSSVKLSVGTDDGMANGVLIQKKVGKKWVDVSRTSGSYSTRVKDTGLTKNTKYTYRAKVFYYNKNTDKTSQSSSWFEKDVYTWAGNSLNLKANVSGKNVKLSWKKIPNVVKYEVYRGENSISSGSDITEKGEAINGYYTKKLVKTLKKKSKSYTDKKLKANQNYSYTIKAIVSIDGKEYVVEDAVTAQTKSDINSIDMYNANFRHYYTSKNTVKCEWNKIAGVGSYSVEKYNFLTKRYEVVKKLKGTATSYTLPKVEIGNDAEYYLIKVLNKKGSVLGYFCSYYTDFNYSGINDDYGNYKYYEGLYPYWNGSYQAPITVEPKLAAVKGVKVVATKEGIKISWKAVANATGYKIYRSHSNSPINSKDTKTYSYSGYAIDMISDFVKYENYDPKYYTTDGYYKFSEITTGTSYVNKVTVEAPEEPEYQEYPKAESYANYSEYRAAYDAVLNANAAAELAYNEQYNNWYHNQYQPDSVDPGKTYHYTVVAVFEKDIPGRKWDDDKDDYVDDPANPRKVVKGNSIGSLKEMISAMFTTVKVDKVKSLKVKSNGEVSFKKSKGAKGYYIYRSTKKSSGFTKVGQTTKTKFKDTTATKGKKYYYRVEAYKLSEAGGVVTSGAVTTKKAVTIKK